MREKKRTKRSESKRKLWGKKQDLQIPGYMGRARPLPSHPGIGDEGKRLKSDLKPPLHFPI